MGQWKEALERLDLDIDMIDAFGGNPRWRDEMTDGIRDVANDIRRALVILTTHDTFYKDDFKEFLTLAKCKLFLIADEVHGTGSELRVSGLTDQYDFRLGLSATPSRWFDPEGTGFLLDYFGVKEEESIFVFSLEDAIRTINPETGETYLTPYEYKPQFIELTDDEMDEYIAKTRKIARSFYSSKNRAEKDEYFSLLCAYSDALWPLIPNQSGHLFRSIVASHSDPIWPPLKG
jgi:superfamily II DNA or RNA helicase